MDGIHSTQSIGAAHKGKRHLARTAIFRRFKHIAALALRHQIPRFGRNGAAGRYILCCCLFGGRFGACDSGPRQATHAEPESPV